MILGLEFPPISHLVEWHNYGSGPFAVNKVIVLIWLSVIIAFTVMYLGGRKQQLVPTGVQNLAESTVGFIEDGIVLETIGPDGLKYTPFLLTLFIFVLTCNFWGLIPGAQMPVNARIAIPIFLAGVVYFLYHYVGIRSQGPWGYLKSIMFMPGVPWPMFILLTPIELVTKFITQPLSMAVRLFANMLAGHLLLVSFAVITAGVLSLGPTLAIWPFSFILLVFLSTFEVLVAFLQAYIFTILAAVYIASAMHPEH